MNVSKLRLLDIHYVFHPYTIGCVLLLFLVSCFCFPFRVFFFFFFGHCSSQPIGLRPTRNNEISLRNMKSFILTLIAINALPCSKRNFLGLNWNC